MQTFSTESAQFTDEFGIQIGRWAQYAQNSALPFDAMWCVIPPGSQSEEDHHPEVELAIVVSGEATFRSQDSPDSELDAPLGTAVLLSSYERHVVHNRSEDAPLGLLSIYWMPDDPTRAAGED